MSNLWKTIILIGDSYRRSVIVHYNIVYAHVISLKRYPLPLDKGPFNKYVRTGWGRGSGQKR